MNDFPSPCDLIDQFFDEDILSTTRRILDGIKEGMKYKKNWKNREMEITIPFYCGYDMIKKSEEPFSQEPYLPIIHCLQFFLNEKRWGLTKCRISKDYESKNTRHFFLHCGIIPIETIP
jgi:hypothetical protein